ncbi:MAG: cysteine--tRNA ligase [Holosporaceae bacterium]|jgi:cysteinyl-tRNA synthetase|nr:cysteine--tRNA ligase [Holosporaceae bacterium]
MKPKQKLLLYNSLSNALEEFLPIDENNVRMYACGPTVYASPHIGNARPLVIFDVLFRLLQARYPKVTYVRNITDIDDKINARARDMKISIEELTTEVTKEFHKNIALLGVLPVTHEPRATAHIAEMIEIIQKLLDGGFAYENQEHVLFHIRKIHQYGILSKRDLNDMIAGSRVEIAPYKKDPLDFVLWKPSNEEGMPSWDSPFGLGRPGWHIECSAMSHRYLGEQFDIHAGGQDLMFPHHENELAQNFGAFGCIMANFWLHNGMLLVNGQKMSKSLWNIIALDDALEQLDGEVIRYILLSAHYQKTLDWTDSLVIQARRSLNRLYGALRISSGNETKEERPVQQSRVLDVLCENLNTPLALRILHEISDEIYKTKDQKEIDALCNRLRQEAELLGLLMKNTEEWFQGDTVSTEERDEIEKLIEERLTAKARGNFQRADEIRQELLARGIQIEDTLAGTVWKNRSTSFNPN